MLDLAEINGYVRALNDGNESSARDAISALKLNKDADWASVPNKTILTLVESLQQQIRGGTKQTSIRQDAVLVLGNLGQRAEPAISLLTTLLHQGTPDGVREAAAAALGMIGKAAQVAVDDLLALLPSQRASLVAKTVRALGEIGCADQRVRSALVSLWQPTASVQKVQIQLAIALCKLKINAPGLQKYLTKTLAPGNEVALRKSAAEALGWCNKSDVDVVPALLLASEVDTDEEVGQAANASLSRMHVSREKAIELCAKQLDESPYAEAALRKCGEPAVGALAKALTAPEAGIREKAARILGSIAEVAAAAVPGLTKTLRDKNLEVRLAAAKSLWRITKNPDVVIPEFVDLLSEKWASSFEPGDSRRKFLQAVMESLGRIGPPAKAAIPALTDRTKDKNRLISECAFTALKEIS
jgi:hypothetical protein